MNLSFIVGAFLSFFAGILHVGCIIFGASWYRFLGAGEEMAVLAEQGSLVPSVITLCIALLLFLFSAYALSGAGVIAKLPLLRSVLVFITSIYLIRGLGGMFFLLYPGLDSAVFVFWSSIICIFYGGFYLTGLKQQWRTL